MPPKHKSHTVELLESKMLTFLVNILLFISALRYCFIDFQEDYAILYYVTVPGCIDFTITAPAQSTLPLFKGFYQIGILK